MSNAKKHLLAVEDDKGLQSQLRWAFEGFEVAVAGDREEAGGCIVESATGWRVA